MNEQEKQFEEKRLKAQRSRNIAIGLILGGLVATFYLATLFKFGPALQASGLG